MNCKQYNFSNLISGRHYEENEGFIDTPMSERVEMLWKFKEFLLENCRKNSRPYNAVCSLSIDNLPNNFGIFERLYINNRTGNAGYISGQDYNSEMKTIKDLIVKYCY